MSGFHDIPLSIVEGAILHQYLVELHSVRVDFSNGISFLTQTAINQRISEEAEYLYDIEHRQSPLILDRFLGCAVSALAVDNDNELEIIFGDKGSLVLLLTKERDLEAVTVFNNGVLEYAIS